MSEDVEVLLSEDDEKSMPVPQSTVKQKPYSTPETSAGDASQGGAGASTEPPSDWGRRGSQRSSLKNIGPDSLHRALEAPRVEFQASEKRPKTPKAKGHTTRAAGVERKSPSSVRIGTRAKF